MQSLPLVGEGYRNHKTYAAQTQKSRNKYWFSSEGANGQRHDEKTSARPKYTSYIHLDSLGTAWKGAPFVFR